MAADFAKNNSITSFCSANPLTQGRTIFRPGKNCDGYYTNAEILEQATKAMDILDHDYPNERHVFAYDNATTHTARAPDALSASKMPAKPSKTFYCDGNDSVRMRDGSFPDGSPQSFYFPNNHPDVELRGLFKGMKEIIRERNEKDAGLPNPYAKKFLAQCKNFKCPVGRTDCCCRRVLYCQPDFVNQKSILQEHCTARGYEVVYFPKFHCELNFIEQCWGYAKRLYRLCPTSTKEDDLERNMLQSLDAVPLKSMRKFATRSNRFMDAYRKGLNGRKAAWAGKKYHGHRVLPENILEEFDQAHPNA
ncbi:hypothetical protein ARMGADRAFT_1048481 [Armillaria gallica]|uniref:Tc1-like transposase DDE domain-containing protein n=1 Tax=Armillaria gallica TaxID=47427 RepID=A0A2H3CXR5_ARMGA|nr:hypothetical protein ARMGADRAFT_1048481 [Armillaria gallica]